MSERLRSEWFTLGASLLLLAVHFLVHSPVLTTAAAALLLLCLVFVRTDRLLGGRMAVMVIAVLAVLVATVEFLR